MRAFRVFFFAVRKLRGDLIDEHVKCVVDLGAKRFYFVLGKSLIQGRRTRIRVQHLRVKQT